MKVNRDVDIPNIWENKSHVPVTTNQYILIIFDSLIELL